jgi:DNA repair protein NreA
MVNDSDIPTDWLRQGLGIEDIVRLRAETIRGVSKVAPYLDPIQEIAMAPCPVGIEASFDRPVRFNPDFDRVTAPVGCSGTIARLEVLDHPGTHRAVDRVASDTDLSAGEACITLHQSGIDVYRIAPLFTAGLLGKRRRIVPTRWAITAVDDSVSTAQKKAVSRCSQVQQIQLHYSELFGNRIAVILIPGDWRYEMIERWGPRSLWAGESESIVRDGEALKKTGYSPITGAYYSARLAVTEHLVREQRCARVIVIRNVEPSYWAPLGTWVVREATRRAMAERPFPVSSLTDAIGQAGVLTGFFDWPRHSALVPEIRSQKTLFEF